MDEATTVNINDGNGMYDKYGLLRSIRNDLCGFKIRADELSTAGVLIVDIINRIDALVDGLRREDELAKQAAEQQAQEASAGRCEEYGGH